MSEEKKTCIFETKNYNKSLDSTEEVILHKYCELVNEYLFHITENIMIQNKEYYIFILLILSSIFKTVVSIEHHSYIASSKFFNKNISC